MNKFLTVLGFATLFILCIFAVDKKNAPDEETADSWHKDPRNWKLWIFYVNPADKRLLPPKRVKGMGWTVNFGNPYSVLAILILLGVIFALEYLL